MRKLLLLIALLLSPAIYAQQQNFPPGGSGSVSGLTPGTNSNVGQFAWSQAGVFTLAQQNDPYLFTLTGGGTCNILSIINGGGTTIKLTDGLASCVNLPTSGVTNGFTNALAGYCLNANGNNTGQFGNVGCVGVYTGIQCSGTGATPSHCWGANFAVTDVGSTGATMYGNEYDVYVSSTATTGAGTIYSFRGTAQPTADNFPAVAVIPSTGTGLFTSGFECQPGSLATPFPCVYLQQNTTGVSNSQFVKFQAKNDASVVETATINLHLDNVLLSASPGFAINNASGEESYGILLTATAAQPHGTLVKIDTAHADAFVICTTVDTVCDGFVQGTNNTSGLCIIASTVCPIVTVSGSKVQGIVGTGTCAIGNFVIVDTTTNGRVKCTASQPAVGAVIGKALSVQGSVGSLVDILTKFQ